MALYCLVKSMSMLQHRDFLSCLSSVNQLARAATFFAKTLTRNPRNGHLSSSIDFYNTPLIELAVLLTTTTLMDVQSSEIVMGNNECEPG
jgi:hypothetical protein